ncbi:DNA polymerase II [Acinetobacter phage MD-2021a]|uniref:DNA-directed DNA polymerase n=2 Tax=Lazarusvirus TaxID=2842820 RepID=A0A6B9SS86_9CAUD|nr:DNA polymerase [Acinetobacter phage vB_AbaM_Lazarus]QGT54105.1 split DNA polymerase [Acinetobacter phage Stupor]QKN88035.1 split DNA polymerase [Acinetobacter phage Abraxas]UJH94884.1 putative DNA polymerase [Acinetobacter phage PhaR5]UYL85865.1 DNA polymerase [Acinetobacter phage vB_AbaM_DP45]CAH1068383.1 DNA polymerase II [Acinetobacter phage MD-2021a]
MDNFYLVVEQSGDLIQERYVENGVEKVREIPYEPTLFIHAKEGVESKYKDIYGKPCIPKRFSSIREAKDWMQKTRGIVEILGMDDFKLAYISDVYGKKDITYSRNAIRVANCDIEVTAGEFPNPTFAKYEIDAITHYDSIDDKYYVFDLLNSQRGRVSKWDPVLAGKSIDEGGDEVPQHILDKVVYMSFETEKEMLLEYIRLWEEKTPVIFTGWNVEGFDIPYIVNRIKNVLGVSNMKRLSPFGKVTSKVIQNMYGDKEIFNISGIMILDYMDLYKKFAFTSQPSYKLDYIAEYEAGINKLEYDGPIDKLRESNHQRYISYNIVDVYCVQAIDAKRGFINLSISMGYYARMNIATVMSPVKTWDAIIFNSLKAEHLVLPEAKPNVRQPYEGAYVKNPVPGAYKYVLSFDVTSLYPSIIRQVNISPETIAGQFAPPKLSDFINKIAPSPSNEFSCSPSGMMYSKTKQGIIPQEITKVFFQRKEWKKKMMAAKRNAEVIKKLMK